MRFVDDDDYSWLNSSDEDERTRDDWKGSKEVKSNDEKFGSDGPET